MFTGKLNPCCIIFLHSFSAAGISRSVTLCTVYIMTVSSLTYEEATAVMQYSRSVAGPNFGFRMQMKKYSKTILEQVGRGSIYRATLLPVVCTLVFHVCTSQLN